LPPPRVPAKPKASVWGTPWPLEPDLLRVRLKYIAARFLQMPEPRMSLRNTNEILSFAQMMEDDGHARAAVELTRLAIEEDPEQRKLWLYLLGRMFIAGHAADYLDVAMVFSRQFPGDAVNAEIGELGKWLAAFGQPAPNPERVHMWSASTLLGRDGASQRDFHALLAQVAASPPLR
jgi:hypothetical protein